MFPMESSPGAPQDDPDLAARIQRGRRVGALVVGGIVAVSLLAGLVSWLGGSDDEPGSDFGPATAEVMCEDFVRDELRSPGSAEFQRPTTVEFGPSRFEVSGTVDAENGFGALIRESYVCTVEGSDGVATLLDLQLD